MDNFFPKRYVKFFESADGCHSIVRRLSADINSLKCFFEEKSDISHFRKLEFMMKSSLCRKLFPFLEEASSPKMGETKYAGGSRTSCFSTGGTEKFDWLESIMF